MVLIYKEMKLINCYHYSYHECMRKVQLIHRTKLETVGSDGLN